MAAKAWSSDGVSERRVSPDSGGYLRGRERLGWQIGRACKSVAYFANFVACNINRHLDENELVELDED